MAGNESLHKAAAAKKDEFYTQLSDIENELRHYKAHFKDKVVFCNCDDPYESNFFKYFAMNFNSLGLKKLITTCYATSSLMYTQLSLLDEGETYTLPNNERKPYKVEITEVADYNADGRVDLADVEYLLKNHRNTCTLLEGDGDFRSDECVELLKETDIVVTNPPFSLFREYVHQLIEYEKKFIIIGNKNAITYKEFFPLLKNNKIWIGFNAPTNFMTPQGLTEKVNGLCRWFTNLDITKRHENIILYKHYNPEEYPQYANYPAIEVSKVSDIPCDYYDEMGVPITFLDKYNPEQFEIIGSSRWLGKPMSEIATKGSYVSGGIRFYIPIDNSDEMVYNNKRAQSTEHRAQSTEHRAQSTEHRAQSTEHRFNIDASMTELSLSVKYRRLYDRIVIKRRIKK